jgi:hypothetical protein
LRIEALTGIGPTLQIKFFNEEIEAYTDVIRQHLETLLTIEHDSADFEYRLSLIARYKEVIESHTLKRDTIISRRRK